MGKINYEIHSCNDLREIIRNNFGNNTVFYRGQLEKYETINSSLSRNSGFIDSEYNLFNKTLEEYPDEFNKIKLPIEKLAKIQHYETPTRLIDFTKSWKVALYFAVEKEDDEKTNSLLYVYNQPLQSLDDKNVRLISILPTINSFEIESIKKAYELEYKELITKEEILSLIPVGAFVEMSRKYLENNDRMRCQKGLFFLCGNKVKKDSVTKNIKELNIDPNIIIRIPYEFRKEIKSELDAMGVNRKTIYPEFPSCGIYNKEKYKKECIDLDKCFRIIKTDDVSHAKAKRLSVDVVLNQTLSIENIKNIAKEIIEYYRQEYDVVWVYIADTTESYISKNWVLKMQWVDLKLKEKYRPLSFGKIDEYGYSFEIPKGYSLNSDFYNENIFKENQFIFRESNKILEEIIPCLNDMSIMFSENNFEKLRKYGMLNKEKIANCFLKIGDVGLSRNIEFNNFIDKYIELISALDNAMIFLNREDLNDMAYKYMVSKYLEESFEKFEEIKKGIHYWEKFFEIKETEH